MPTPTTEVEQGPTSGEVADNDNSAGGGDPTGGAGQLDDGPETEEPAAPGFEADCDAHGSSDAVSSDAGPTDSDAEIGGDAEGQGVHPCDSVIEDATGSEDDAGQP